MDTDRDPLLEAVLSGDVPADAPEVRARAERDPAFAERLAALDEVRGALHRAAEFERESLDEVDGMAPAEGEERLRRAALDRLAPRRPRALRWAGLAAIAAAAAALFLVLGPRRDGPAGLDPQGTLGVDHGLLAPIGQVPDFARFEWSAEIPGTFFSVIIRDDAGREIDREEHLMARSWSPAEERREAWPDVIRWNLEAWIAVGSAPRVSPSVRAWRSR